VVVRGDATSLSGPQAHCGGAPRVAKGLSWRLEVTVFRRDLLDILFVGARMLTVPLDGHLRRIVLLLPFLN
jgi:hypothetical protein